MGGMSELRRLLLTVGAASAALILLAMPVAAEAAAGVPLAAEAGDEATEEPAEGESGESGGEGERVPIAETPRDRIGLILLAALILGGGLAVANGRRQLKGERPQASGEFRWR